MTSARVSVHLDGEVNTQCFIDLDTVHKSGYLNFCIFEIRHSWQVIHGPNNNSSIIIPTLGIEVLAGNRNYVHPWGGLIVRVSHQ